MEKLTKLLEEAKTQKISQETKVRDLHSKVLQMQAETLSKESENQALTHQQAVLRADLVHC